MKKSKLKQIIKEEIKSLNETWLPTEFRDELDMKLISTVYKKLDSKTELMYAFIVQLLEHINEHGMAKKINDIFDKDLG